ncbi:uncharacterized protein LOC132313994 [Cornus florida]|uniref:uncharacterized protein LOC132313994 n=1 Tax=Cornus florida TaxID=4283 RepID=UPI00289FFB1B|nr:uncharacterized protein LOC132313994 [Cornus florida]
MDINADNVVDSEIEDLTENTDDGKLVWDDSHLEAFIICMEEEVYGGNRNNTTFTPNGWKNIRKGLSRRTGKNYELKQLKSKFNHLRVDYRAFMSLLGETGVGYNAETGIVVVENERWTRLIKVNSQYGKYRTKPCNHFDKLTTVFGGTHATGAHGTWRIIFKYDTTNPGVATRGYGMELGESYLRWVKNKLDNF